MVLPFFREIFTFALDRHLNLGPKGIELIRWESSIFWSWSISNSLLLLGCSSFGVSFESLSFIRDTPVNPEIQFLYTSFIIPPDALLSFLAISGETAYTLKGRMAVEYGAYLSAFPLALEFCPLRSLLLW